MVKMGDDAGANYREIGDWQALVNKPVIAIDGQEIGIVRSIQAESLMVDYGPITTVGKPFQNQDDLYQYKRFEGS
jgi:hypothetical protein